MNKFIKKTHNGILYSIALAMLLIVYYIYFVLTIRQRLNYIIHKPKKRQYSTFKEFIKELKF